MSALVEIRDLLVQRGKRSVLKVDSLDIQKGEVLAVVGPNGAGKSTLLLALARLIRAERGQIRFNGGQVEAEPPSGMISDTAYRRRLGLVLQDPLLFDTTVHDNVAIGLRFRKLPKSDIEPRVKAWLERLGISDLGKRRASQLSGGEAQRVSLARALVLDPKLLLMDEPFAALDPPTRVRLLDDLRGILSDSGTTTIFVTHNLSEAEKLADRMAVFLNGEVTQVGLPQEIMASPLNTDVAAFFAQSRN